MTDSITERLAAVEERIHVACERAGRERSEITLVAVSKTFPSSAIDEAIRAGVTDIGENRVQEAAEKLPQVVGDAVFHLIGHLQSNKSRLASSLFDVVQTVDSIKLGRRLDEAAEESSRRHEILIQVNVGNERQKDGVSPDQATLLATELARFQHLDLSGLMTIPPVADEAETRVFFRRLRELRDAIADRLELETFRKLSMGMSSDYQIAIEEGATIVRIGSAIFGSRG